MNWAADWLVRFRPRLHACPVKFLNGRIFYLCNALTRDLLLIRWKTGSLVLRAVRAIRVTWRGLEPSAIARRIFPTNLTGDVTSEITEDDGERGWKTGTFCRSKTGKVPRVPCKRKTVPCTFLSAQKFVWSHVKVGGLIHLHFGHMCKKTKVDLSQYMDKMGST